MPAMDTRVNGSGLDDRAKLAVPAVGANTSYNGVYAGNGHTGGSSTNSSVVGGINGAINGYTLMVAGQRTGKTSFLRLLLDSTEISQTATKEQLASVAKFIQGCSGHTSHIRTASVDVELDVESNGVLQPLALTLVDTPSLKFDDDSSERMVTEILRHVESRFAEGIEDEWKARSGDHHVHLCIYFLDPEDIVPPPVPAPPAPLVPRARTNSFSQPDPEPVILEPPVTTNPLLRRPTLRPAQISIIRRLSARVNVLPVIARADTLTNDRLTAVRMAVRRDLAEAGIGFGIFDTDNHPQAVESTASANGDLANGYSSRPNGSSLSPRGSSSSASATPPYLRLPYALISPDIYSHTDGVIRASPTRHELIQQYTPSTHPSPPSKLVRGKFIRSYRWGSLDIMDPTHSDFLALRTALFHHMETLQKYTREYLFDRFRVDYFHQHHQQIPASHHSAHHLPPSIVSRSHLPPLSSVSRPILAIDTAPSRTATLRHPSHPVSRDTTAGRDNQATPSARGPHSDPLHSNPSARVSPAATRSSKQRTKKITVACNFCRSRKLKCDGGRPACGQCVKRSNPCDYQPQSNKRRGTQRQRRQGDDSDSDLISGEDPSADPSLSPDVSSHSVSRRGSNVERNTTDSYSPTVVGLTDRHDDQVVPAHMGQAATKPLTAPADHRPVLFKDNELPHIATLSFSGDSLPASHNGSMQGPSLPPIRPASEQQAAQRKRASTMPGRTRAASTTGPKIVACNFCRARKTKCDGAHPTCSSCSRRTLPCNYNHDEPTTNLPISRKKPRQSSTSKSGPATSPPSQSPPTSSQGALVGQAPVSVPDGSTHREDTTIDQSEIDLKRKIEDSEPTQNRKRLRTEDSPTATDIS